MCGLVDGGLGVAPEYSRTAAAATAAAARTPGRQGVLAGPGTIIHPSRDKIGLKWVAIKAFEASGPGFYAEFRCGSF